MKAAWYLRRLRAMSTGEILWRLRILLLKQRLRWAGPPTIRRIAPIPQYPAYEGRAHLAAHEAGLLHEARQLLRHSWSYGGMAGQREERINWHMDPQTGRVAPLSFSFSVPYRDARQVGDIRNIWEKNRHHHLCVLAMAFHLQRDERYSEEVMAQMQDWLQQNPCLRGVNWAQPLEMAIRLIAWAWIERLLRRSVHYAQLFGEDSPIWDAIGQQQRFIADLAARGSSANNHLIGEMAGLFIAAQRWPIFEESARWRDTALQELERALQEQTFASGLNREQAFGYHVFVLEFALLAYYEAPDAFSPTSVEIMRRMMQSVWRLQDRSGALPRFGDDDDGRAVQLSPRSASRLDWLEHMAALLPGLNRKSPPERDAWPDAGRYILAHDRGKPGERFALIDAGPHGYLSIAAHAHADALSFTLALDGHPFLVDPGTYTYYAEAAWRDLFRSTRAHNTLMLDGLEQSQAAGPFLWTSQARTRVLDWSPVGGRLVAEHDGYLQSRGVLHRRTWQLQKDRLRIIDEINGQALHDLVWAWHFHPDCQLTWLDAQHCMITNQASRMILQMPTTVRLSQYHGVDGAAWYAPEYGLKQASWLILGFYSGLLPVSVETLLEFT